MPPVLPHVKAGMLRALGLTTPARAIAPEVPTTPKAGACAVDLQNWHASSPPLKPRTIGRIDRESQVAAVDDAG